MSAQSNVTAGNYIINPKFDRTWVLGGAGLTLALPLLAYAAPELLPWFFWAWIVFFEGSHFWATISRTYLDRKFSFENRGVLLGSLIFFVLPALAIVHWQSTGSKLAIDLYGFGIFVWSLYHNARQHFGFFSIYSKKQNDSQAVKSDGKFWLYAAIVAPQFHFLMFQKGPAALSFFPSREALGTLAFGLDIACWAISALAGWVLLRRWVSTRASGVPMTWVYSAVCFVFYTVMFYAVAPREPFYPSAQNGAQGLMLLAVMNSLFHNIQYHAIVWAYARKRYQESGRNEAALGWAARINGSLGSYLLMSTLMGLGFAWIVWGLGDWPSITGTFEPRDMSSLSYVLFFGIIGHHFYLDQHIWRPSKQPELRSYLGMNDQAGLQAAAG